MLRREVVGLGFAFLADELGLLGALVHVQGDRAHVVEELGIDRPLAILLPDSLADEGGAAVGDGLPQGEALFAGDAVAEALVGTRPSLAASVVEANQRSSMPPRLAP